MYIYFIHKKYKIDYENIYGALAYPYCKEILFTQRNQEQIEELFKKLDLMLERIAKKDFKKEPKLGWNIDNCTFCSYLNRCEKL